MGDPFMAREVGITRKGLGALASALNAHILGSMICTRPDGLPVRFDIKDELVPA
jgi:hypothetical protein